MTDWREIERTIFEDILPTTKTSKELTAKVAGFVAGVENTKAVRKVARNIIHARDHEAHGAPKSLIGTFNAMLAGLRYD